MDENGGKKWWKGKRHCPFVVWSGYTGHLLEKKPQLLFPGRPEG